MAKCVGRSKPTKQIELRIIEDALMDGSKVHSVQMHLHLPEETVVVDLACDAEDSALAIFDGLREVLAIREGYGVFDVTVDVEPVGPGADR